MDHPKKPSLWLTSLLLLSSFLSLNKGKNPLLREIQVLFCLRLVSRRCPAQFNKAR